MGLSGSLERGYQRGQRYPAVYQKSFYRKNINEAQLIYPSGGNTMTKPIIDVPGIGPETAAILEENGIRTVEDLVAQSVAQIALLKTFSEIRAARIIAAAKALLTEEAAPLEEKPKAEKKADTKKKSVKKAEKNKDKLKENKKDKPEEKKAKKDDMPKNKKKSDNADKKTKKPEKDKKSKKATKKAKKK